MNRRRGVWLALAGVLLALGALLMLWGQGDEPAPEPPKVDFPRTMRGQDWKRAQERRTQTVPAPPPKAGEPVVAPPPRDPVLAALPRGKGHSAVVLEANALRYSPIGELLLDCLMADGGKNMEEFRKISGVDPLQDLDRVVITDEGVVFSGNFGKARFREIFQDQVSADYGPGARVYEPGRPDTSDEGAGTRTDRGTPAVGTWNDQLVVLAKTPGTVKEVLDRVQGNGSDELPLFSEGSTYGEMYGMVSVDQLARMIPPEQGALIQSLREIADSVELHMDASSDMALVAEIRGSDAAKVTDLGKSMGAALSLARLKAQADGNTSLAQMLDFAKVEPDGSTFKLELAVPLDVIKERLAFCRQPRPAPPPPQSTDAKP